MKNEKNIIDNLLAFIIIFVSITGWNLLDYIGMNKFWAIFIILSSILMLLIMKFSKEFLEKKKIIKDIFKNKLNVFILILLVWCTVTYFINYTGIGTILYIIKFWFIVGVYVIAIGIYFKNQSKHEILKTVDVISKYIFILGCFETIVAFYQFIFSSNKIFGIVISNWPTYNPASFYGNVNGFGTYLYISIIAGLFLLVKTNKKKLCLFSLILQCYALYLTVARTSIISVFIFIVFAIIYITSCKKWGILKQLLNKRLFIIFLISNCIGISILFHAEIKNVISFEMKNAKISGSTQDRTALDILIDKTEKGVNQRQFIWKAVINDAKEYIIFGDGLKYNIIKKINVAKVISERSVGVDRISYHNTLFRYFASHGIIGLFLFLLVMAYAPLTLIIRIIKYKKIQSIWVFYIIFSTTIFAYMQMEEVYIGEIGMLQLINLLTLTLGGYLVNKKSNC